MKFSFVWVTDLLFSLLSQIVFISAGAVWRCRVLGLHNIPKTSGFIVASNHQSLLDPILVTAILRRRIFYFLRTTLSGAFFNLITAPYKLVYVKRGEPDIGAVRKAVDVVRGGNILLLFPEGTRSRDGGIGKLKRGFALVSRTAGCAVLPIFIGGAYKCWSKGSPLPWLGCITVRVFPPYVPVAGAANSDDACVKYVAECWSLAAASQ